MNNKKIILLVVVITFLMALAFSLVAGIVVAAKALSNPEMTQTQIIIWFFAETKWWVWVVMLIISYIAIGIMSKKQ